jgi:cytochrome b
VLADLLMVAVALHLAGVALMSWLWRENLPGAMLTGRKRGPGSP